MVTPRVDKQMLRELESMGFPIGCASRALHYSGNSSIRDAINWIFEHEGDLNFNQMPQVPIDIKIESGNPSQGEVKMKLKDIRIIALHESEEGRATRKIWWQQDQHKEERRKLGLSPQNPGAVKHTKPPILKGNVLKKTRSVSPAMQDTMKDCLRSLKKNHKNDDAKVKKALQTLLILVGNVARNPDNEKYRKIRLSNPIFQDRVGKFKEGIEFLELCGFKRLEGNGFLYVPRNKVEMTVLNSAGWALNSATTNPFFGLLSL